MTLEHDVKKLDSCPDLGWDSVDFLQLVWFCVLGLELK